jgi:hypothetical protein
MIRKPVLLLGMLGVALFVLTACNDNNAVTLGRPTGTVMGRVIDGTMNQPLAGVTVQITSKPFVNDTTDVRVIQETVTTDPNGLFDRTDIPNGEVEVKVWKTGFLTPDMQKWALTPGGTTNLVFTMYPGTDPPTKFEGDEMSAWPPDYQG